MNSWMAGAETMAAATRLGGSGAHAATLVLVGVCGVGLLAAAALSLVPGWRRTVIRVAAVVAGGVVAAYLVGRGVAEFFIVDYTDPASYAHSWGGPSLVGVFAVHSGPGALVVVAVAVWLTGRWRRVLRGRTGPAGGPDALGGRRERKSA